MSQIWKNKNLSFSLQKFQIFFFLFIYQKDNATMSSAMSSNGNKLSWKVLGALRLWNSWDSEW